MDDFVPVFIVAIIFGFVSFTTYLSNKTKQMQILNEKQGSQFDAENEELRATIDSMEKRIQVLESIVTSKNFQVTQEFDALAE